MAVERKNPTYVQESGNSTKANQDENRLLHLIDHADAIKRYEKHTRKLADGTLQVPGFMRAIAGDAALVLASLMLAGENDKIKLEAAKDVLDRAGHGKTTKVSIAGSMNVSHESSRVELINLIMSSVKKTGIKTKDEPAYIDAVPPSIETVDVTASAPAGLSDVSNLTSANISEEEDADAEGDDV